MDPGNESVRIGVNSSRQHRGSGSRPDVRRPPRTRVAVAAQRRAARQIVLIRLSELSKPPDARRGTPRRMGDTWEGLEAGGRSPWEAGTLPAELLPLGRPGPEPVRRESTSGARRWRADGTRVLDAMLAGRVRWGLLGPAAVESSKVDWRWRLQAPGIARGTGRPMGRWYHWKSENGGFRRTTE